MTADIESMAELVQWGLLQFVSAILLLTFAFTLLLVLSWQLTIVALLVMPVLIIASRKFQRDSNAAYLVVREPIRLLGASLAASAVGMAAFPALLYQATDGLSYLGSTAPWPGGYFEA